MKFDDEIETIYFENEKQRLLKNQKKNEELVSKITGKNFNYGQRTFTKPKSKEKKRVLNRFKNK